eukprot:gene1658-2867_t
MKPNSVYPFPAMRVCLSWLSWLVATAAVRVSNLEPKIDVHGDIVNGHDGSLALDFLLPKHGQGTAVARAAARPARTGTYRRFNGMWYYHAAEYGLCREPPKNGCDQTPDHCGSHGDHNVTIYRSPDLSSGSWEFVGRAMRCVDLPDCGVLYRPHLVCLITAPPLLLLSSYFPPFCRAKAQCTARILLPAPVYNPTTSLYTLFVNYVRKDGSYGGNAVYTAKAPEGPFTLANPVMNLARLCPGPAASKPCGPAQRCFLEHPTPTGMPCALLSRGGAGDFDVFVDSDGSGYIVYGSNFYMSVEELTPDFLNSTGKNASAGGKFGGTVFPDYFVESPSMFVRQGTYHLLYGHCCCFCYQGSGIISYTAPHPMGPWTPASPSGQDLGCVEASDPLHASGYRELGNGSCRDGQGNEPSYYSVNGPLTADQCAGECAGLPHCEGFSYCSDKCPGSCHLYVTPGGSSPDNSSNWHYTAGNGDAGHINKTSPEPWWGCYVKQQAGQLLGDPAAHVAPELGLATGHLGGEPTPGQGCMYGPGNQGRISTTRAQQNFNITVPTPQGDVFLWTAQPGPALSQLAAGDRWQQSPDGLKGHEGQSWIPLEFDQAGAVQAVRWSDECVW